MASSAIPTSVKYFSDGSMAAWPIPFPFSSAADVAVKIVDDAGRERRLAPGRDYIVNDNCVVAVTPPGESIVIWLDAALETAIRARAAQAVGNLREGAGNAAGGAYFARSATSPAVQSVGPDHETARILDSLANQVKALKQDREAALVSARRAEADEQVRRLANEGDTQAARLDRETGQSLAALRESAKRLIDELREAGGESAASAGRAARDALNNAEAAVAAAEDAVARAQKAAENAASGIRVMEALAGGAVNAEGFWIQERDVRAGEALELPAGLVYHPGRAMLRVSHQGAMLAHGVNYEEMGTPDALSSRIRPLFDSPAGSQWLFWVVASNVGAAAEDAARRAGESALNAGTAAEEAACSAEKAGEHARKARNAADNAGRWASAGEESADNAAAYAKISWNAAYAAGTAASRPGIAAVKRFEELAHCVSGLYIINPLLTHSPSMFMGVWPVASVADMTWDGVFFLGPAYPEHPTPPPAPCPPPDKPDPDDPGGDDERGDGWGWLPCGKCRVM